MILFTIIAFFGFILFCALIPQDVIEKGKKMKHYQKRYKDETNWLYPGTVQLHGSAKMSWDLWALLEKEEDIKRRWLTKYEVSEIEQQFKKDLAENGVNYQQSIWFQYDSTRRLQTYPHRKYDPSK